MKKFFEAATSNELVNTANSKGKVAGFWQGLWNGFSFPFAFFISLFNKNIGLYEAHNNGGWYNFGFFFGLAIVMGGNKGVKINSDKKGCCQKGD